MRVISLLASATEIVCALDAGEMLVGRSHECDNPSWVRRLPPCSAPTFDVSVSSGEIDAEVRRRLRAGQPLYQVDGELIRELNPDLLITQAHCEVCAVTPADVERSGALPFAPPQVTLSASSIEGILGCIREIAGCLGLEERAETVIDGERRRLETVRRLTASLRRPPIVMLEWTDPLFAMGNWAPELVEIAGGDLLLGRGGEASVAMRPDELRAVDPEFIIVAPCGFNLERALREKAFLERYDWWQDLRAVQHGNVVFADGNLYFNRAGMTISRTAEIIAEILHGLDFGASEPETQRARLRYAASTNISVVQGPVVAP